MSMHETPLIVSIIENITEFDKISRNCIKTFRSHRVTFDVSYKN